MLRRTLLKLAASCVVLPALRWLPAPVIEEEYDTVTVYVDTWMDVHWASRGRMGIMVPP